jgi:GTP-binding protein Era
VSPPKEPPSPAVEEAPEGFRSGFVHLLGRTNAGKSTLLNALVRFHVAAVGAAAQTTRHRILAVRHEPECQMVFVDLPGLHRPLHRMNERMLGIISHSLADEPDTVLFVVDASAPFGAGDEFAAEQLKSVSSPAVLVLNKVDLVGKPSLLPLMELYQKVHDFKALVPVSALRGDGLEALLQETRALLPEGPKYFPDDYLTDRPEQFLVEELIREAVIRPLREEIPHSTAVSLEQQEEKENVIVVRAAVWVEKDSQKGIVIGERGRMIKKISTGARRMLEDFFGKKVFLELRVSVKESWRDRDAALDALGITAKT